MHLAVLTLLVAAAPPPQTVVFAGGLIDVPGAVAFVNVADPPNPATAVGADLDPRGSGYLGSTGAIAAIALTTGKRKWTAPGVSGAFHLTGNTLVAWADDAEHATLALLDAQTGKRLRTVTLFDVPPAKSAVPVAPCTLAAPARVITQHQFGGEGEAVWVTSSTLACSAGRARGGARMTEEQLAEDAKRCVASRSVARWSLATGKREPRDVAPTAAATLEQRGRLDVGGLALTLEAGELVARAGEVRRWALPQVVTSVAVAPPCPAPPASARP